MKPARFPRRILASTASLQLTVAALFVLCILVVWGTLYQVDHGIYAAQERFFKSWLIFIAGALPFPGVKTIVVVLSINLLAAAIKRRPVNLRTVGIFVLHIGVAILIGGSAIASSLVRESAITLSPGNPISESYDFTTWELVITVHGRDNNTPFSKTYRYDIRNLRNKQHIGLGECPAGITIRQIYRNCAAAVDPADSQSVIALTPRAPSPEQGRDFPGVVFSVDLRNSGEEPSPDQNIYAGFSQTKSYAIDDDTVSAALMPRALPLPLSIELRNFEAEYHPGTTKAKSFKSRLRIFAKNIDREIVVEMNRPFRYRSFTFYQMGYEGTEGNYSSTLAVVKNPLRYMPYIASIIIVAGIFIHFFVKMMYELIATRRTRHVA